jgi:hypothetical protein
LKKITLVSIILALVLQIIAWHLIGIAQYSGAKYLLIFSVLLTALAGGRLLKSNRKQ